MKCCLSGLGITIPNDSPATGNYIKTKCTVPARLTALWNSPFLTQVHNNRRLCYNITQTLASWKGVSMPTPLLFQTLFIIMLSGKQWLSTSLLKYNHSRNSCWETPKPAKFSATVRDHQSLGKTGEDWKSTSAVGLWDMTLSHFLEKMDTP